MAPWWGVGAGAQAGLELWGEAAAREFEPDSTFARTRLTGRSILPVWGGFLGLEAAVRQAGGPVDVTVVDAPTKVMDAGAQRRVVDALNAVSNGVIRMSDSVPNLVETSTNVGTLTLADGQIEARFR